MSVVFSRCRQENVSLLITGYYLTSTNFLEACHAPILMV